MDKSDGEAEIEKALERDAKLTMEESSEEDDADVEVELMEGDENDIEGLEEDGAENLSKIMSRQRFAKRGRSIIKWMESARCWKARRLL